jgi:anaerobic ribonucleoside-triphosphate reductase activating protein
MDTRPRVRLSRVHHPVTALGYGRRVGVWFQGCSLACSGCLARDTWPLDGGAAVEVEDLAERVASIIASDCLDGATISGGEPFEQPEALSGLLEGVRRRTAGLGREVDLLCYSGLPERRLRRQFPAVLDQLDALIPEPFAENRESEHAWWGSGNQRLVALSPLGRARYAEVPPAGDAIMQVAVEDGRVWLVGVPRRGDLEEATRRAAQAGVHVGMVSWRP